MCEGVSEAEENTLRVLLATMRKHAPGTLQGIVFDVLVAGLKDESVLVIIKGNDDEDIPTDDQVVEATVIAIRGKEQSAKFFKALEAADMDEAEDTQLD